MLGPEVVFSHCEIWLRHSGAEAIVHFGSHMGSEAGRGVMAEGIDLSFLLTHVG